jgi:hypothetical protein
VAQAFRQAERLGRLLHGLRGRAQQPEHQGHVGAAGDAGVLPDGGPAGLRLTGAVQREPLCQLYLSGDEVPVIEGGQPHRHAGFYQEQWLGALFIKGEQGRRFEGKHGER